MEAGAADRQRDPPALPMMAEKPGSFENCNFKIELSPLLPVSKSGVRSSDSSASLPEHMRGSLLGFCSFSKRKGLREARSALEAWVPVPLPQRACHAGAWAAACSARAWGPLCKPGAGAGAPPGPAVSLLCSGGSHHRPCPKRPAPVGPGHLPSVWEPPITAQRAERLALLKRRAQATGKQSQVLSIWQRRQARDDKHSSPSHVQCNTESWH